MKREAMAVMRTPCEHCTRGENTCAPFSHTELKAVLKTLKSKKSPGPDLVTNDMLKQLSRKAEDALLNLINRTWRTGVTPPSWRVAILCPIAKKGKPLEEPGSYRPIALTSCVAKCAERLVCGRLQPVR